MSDLIDRQNAIDAIHKEFDEICVWDESGQATANEVENILYEVPSAEPERKWIPVAEALPKDMDRLLATIVRSDGTKRVRSGNYYKEYFMMDNGDTWNATDKEVLAWMPLPEPWRGE